MISSSRTYSQGGVLLKDWIFTICEINPWLDTLAERAERNVEKLALCHGRNTDADINKVIKFINLKNAYCNLRVIYNSMMNALTDKEAAVLLLAITDSPVVQKAADLGLSRESYYRTLNKALKKCKLEILALGYDDTHPEKEFLHIKPVIDLFNRRKKQLLSRSA